MLPTPRNTTFPIGRLASNLLLPMMIEILTLLPPQCCGYSNEACLTIIGN